VTQNLFSTLQHLRLPDHDRALWVDALCINQADDDEKSRQVDQIRRVYAGSNCTERVLVWLGDDPEGKAKMALDFLVEVEWQDQEAARIRTRVGALVPGRSKNSASSFGDSPRSWPSWPSLPWSIQTCREKM
jgi:hypothetical protein